MKKTFLQGMALLLASMAHAQFYAPETDFHDLSQRTFPVEAARVLAYQQNSSGAAITEVTWQLETQDGDTIWHIQWLDEQKKPLREKTVRYTPSLLLEGPGFFREVFRQLVGDDWLPKPSPSGSVDTAFWDGATLAGVSRLEALAAAGRQIARVPRLESASDAARLAGILAHGAMPALASTLTLDSLYLSRASAWLCLAERIAGTTDDAAWAPILFLSGRESVARDIWQKGGPAVGAGRGDAGRFWDFMLALPSPKDCFLFAAQKANHQFAMPAMLYPAEFEQNCMDWLVELADDVLGKKTVPRFYEYGPNVAIRGHEAGARWGARMPGYALGAWLDTLAEFQPPRRDFTGYKPLLKEAASAADAAGSDAAAAVKVLAPLINLGFEENRGPLIPVATITARDLLGYGWEMAGLQLGYTHNSFSGNLDEFGMSGVSEVVLGGIKGVNVFFRQPERAPRFPLDDLKRLQFLGSSVVEDALVQNLPADWQNPSERYLSRCWLRRGGIAGIEATIRNKGQPEEVRALIDRMRREGGPLAICNLVNGHDKARYPAVIDRLGIREALLAELPWNYHQRAWIAEQKKGKGYEYARRLEQIGWDALMFPNHYLIFSNYLVGGAVESAKRFYDEVLPFVGDGQDFAATTGPARYALAWIEGDEATERQVLEDCNASNNFDARLPIVHAILHGHYDEARPALDDAIDNGNQAWDTALKAYLPQIPALLDVHHADHAHAVDSFPDDPHWLFLRWALARQASLPVDEMVRLFRGKTTGANGLFIAAAREDKDRFWVLNGLTLEPMERTVITHEFLKQQGSTPPREQPDLKPAGAAPLQDLVREELRRQPPH